MKSWQQNWRAGLFPGLSITVLVMVARLLGALQPLEWKALDLSLRWRPAEPADPRITVIAITENDIQSALGHPISDQALASLIQTLQTYTPRAIGIDIFRDRPVGKGYSALSAALQSTDNVIAIDKISEPPIPPPPMLDEAQVGFADAIVDSDGFLRRSDLGSYDYEGNYRFSFTLRLAETYLATDGFTLENGIRDSETMRFGKTEIPRFQRNTGGYVRADNAGNQALINFRAGAEPFAQVPYSAVMSGEVVPELLQDRVLLIGYTAESVKDYASSGAIADSNPSAIPGVTIQAHAVSQILSAVYDQRSFLKTLPSSLEYLLIFSVGLLGMALAYWQRKPTVHLLIVIAISAAWLLLGYLVAITSWWLPLVPTLIVFWMNAVALYPFYPLQSQLSERDNLIDQAYTTIHNGPLQMIAGMLSTWTPGSSAPAEMRSSLDSLNHELRGIREILQREMLQQSHLSGASSGEALVMQGGQIVDLQNSLHIVLHEVYINTIERYRSFFEPVLKVPTFDAMSDSRLSRREKQALGRFLEEALTNICKYAKGTTRVEIVCKRTDTHNIIRVVDNGTEIFTPTTSHEQGFGTQQARQLARQLRGDFSRTSIDPQGTCCELQWPIHARAWRCWPR